MKRRAFDVEHHHNVKYPEDGSRYRVKRGPGQDVVVLDYIFEIPGDEDGAPPQVQRKLHFEIDLAGSGLKDASDLASILERLAGMLQIAETHPFPKSGCTILHAIKDEEQEEVR